MGGDTKAFKEIIIEGMKTIMIGDKAILDANISLFSNMIDSLSEAEMDALVDDLESGKKVIPIIVPNGSNAIDYNNNLDVIERLDLPLHQRIITTTDGVDTMSPIKFLVMEIPLKKPIQMVDKKRSIPKDTNSRNEMTGQVTGDSKSMSATSPEIPLMAGNGMYKGIIELTKYRGGDINAEIALDRMAELGMPIDQDVLERYSSGPEVNNTLKQLLLSMHIDMDIKK